MALHIFQDILIYVVAAGFMLAILASGVKELLVSKAFRRAGHR